MANGAAAITMTAHNNITVFFLATENLAIDASGP
jgi:hypothetical protein